VQRILIPCLTANVQNILDRKFDVGRQVQIYRSAKVYAADEVSFLDGGAPVLSSICSSEEELRSFVLSGASGSE
jgi:hypothetical protein